MILSFRHKGLKQLYQKGDSSKLPPEMVRRIENRLTRLEAATGIQDLKAPGYFLHQLSGDLKDYWAIKVSGNWRMVFKFEDGDALDVNLVDYH